MEKKYYFCTDFINKKYYNNGYTKKNGAGTSKIGQKYNEPNSIKVVWVFSFGSCYLSVAS